MTLNELFCRAALREMTGVWDSLDKKGFKKEAPRCLLVAIREVVIEAGKQLDSPHTRSDWRNTLSVLESLEQTIGEFKRNIGPDPLGRIYHRSGGIK